MNYEAVYLCVYLLERCNKDGLIMLLRRNAEGHVREIQEKEVIYLSVCVCVCVHIYGYMYTDTCLYICVETNMYVYYTKKTQTSQP